MDGLHIYLHVVQEHAHASPVDVIRALSEQVYAMNAELQIKFDELKDKVTAATTVELSAVELIKALAQLVSDLKASVGDNAEALAKIGEIETMVDEGATQLAAAVAAVPPAA